MTNLLIANLSFYLTQLRLSNKNNEIIRGLVEIGADFYHLGEYTIIFAFYRSWNQRQCSGSNSCRRAAIRRVVGS